MYKKFRKISYKRLDVVLWDVKIGVMLDIHTINGDKDKEHGTLVGVFKTAFQWCELDVRCLFEDKAEGRK